MKEKIGVIQGRLLPKYCGRYQAHPVGYWQEEFPIAADLGLDCIEFILDYDNVGANPLMSQQGRQQILSVIRATGVKVRSICADYFMEAPLHGTDVVQVKESLGTLQYLLEVSSELGVQDIVIPCVDHSSLKTSAAEKRFKQNIELIIPKAEEVGINLSLETDLEPRAFQNLLQSLDSPRVSVNYDIGNSAALDYDVTEELQAYGSRISNIHIKDRLLGGGPVKLGEGNANIPRFLRCLRAYNYQGPLIMQAFRDEEGIQIFEEQLVYTRNALAGP